MQPPRLAPLDARLTPAPVNAPPFSDPNLLALRLAIVGSPIKVIMIEKLKSGKFRLYSRKTNPTTGKRRNLGTFDSRTAAERHERAVQYFKHHA